MVDLELAARVVEDTREMSDEIRRLRAMLKRLEWAVPDEDGWPSCFICGSPAETPHLPDCELAALLEGTE